MSFATVAHIPFDTLLNVAFDTMKEHFTAENRSSTTECAHSILPAASLHKATETSLLLALWRHIGWRGNDSSKAGMTAGAVGRSHWGHRHTYGTAQDHRLLPHHLSLLRILGLSIWLRILLLWVLWLTILLLLILWLWLAVRLLAIVCWRRRLVLLFIL